MPNRLVWNKCKGNVWADLFAVELGHPHFDGMEGVYVIWHGDPKPGHVRVGRGVIRQCLADCRNDPGILGFKENNLYVTWARTPREHAAGVERYLCKTLLPKLAGPPPDGPSLEVNLPGEGPSAPARPESDASLPNQIWEELVARDGLPHVNRPRVVPPPPAPPVQAPPAPTAPLRVMGSVAEILTACTKYKSSDILLVPDEPPMIRVDGSLSKLPQTAPLSAADCQKLLKSILNERQWAQFEKEGELDSSYTVDGLRFRVNLYVQQRGMAAAFRAISPTIPDPERLGLSPSIIRLAELPRGMILVTGPTGSGKSTTLASLIEYVNKKYKKHIITIEDPIEYIYQNKSSIIDQREVGQHTSSFAQALKYTLRQNPDIILIGEMRDLETTELSLKAAETGHLCFSTLHTQDAPSTIDRIVTEFPMEQRPKMCNILSNVLTGVICQILVPRKGGGMVCAREVMVMTPAIASLLREGKIHQMGGAIESGWQEGMVTLDQSLASLVIQQLITLEDAMKSARNPRNFRHILDNVQSHTPPPVAHK